jgi:sugar phosphate isomerase/epimerase
MEKLGDRVKTLHIHDNDGFDDLHLAPYLGLNDWDKFLKGIIAINYTGDLNFEIPGSINQVPPALVPSMMRFIADTGKYFRARIEKTRAEQK